MLSTCVSMLSSILFLNAEFQKQQQDFEIIKLNVTNKQAK